MLKFSSTATKLQSQAILSEYTKYAESVFSEDRYCVRATTKSTTPAMPCRGLPRVQRQGKLAGGVPGLVNRHISGRIENNSYDNNQKEIYEKQKVTGEVKVYPGGIMLKKEGLKGAIGVKGGGDRGEIMGFSSDSKRRMRGMLLEVDWEPLLSFGKYAKESRCFFVSLTYPDSFSHDWHVWKGHLKAFRKRIERAFRKNISAIWKYESQPERSERLGYDAPHFHLVIDFKEIMKVSAIRAWIGQAWYETVKSGDPNHLKAGTGADPVYGPIVRLEKYMVKYLGKTFTTQSPTGRVWGVWGEFEKAECSTYTDIDWFKLLRRVRKWGKRSGYLKNIKRVPGAIIYGKGLDQLLRGLKIRQ
jgi:hypothetical protein